MNQPVVTDGNGNVTGKLDSSVLDIPLSQLAKAGHSACNGKGYVVYAENSKKKGGISNEKIIKPCRCVLNSIKRWEEKGYRVRPVNG